MSVCNRYATDGIPAARTAPRPRLAAARASWAALRTRLALALVALASAAHGDEVVLDETRITGNDELPKVLYVLPWRDSRSIPDAPALPTPVLGEVLTPLEPATHARFSALRGQWLADAGRLPPGMALDAWRPADAPACEEGRFAWLVAWTGLAGDACADATGHGDSGEPDR